MPSSQIKNFGRTKGLQIVLMFLNLITNQDRLKLLKLLPPDRKIKDVQTCKYVNFIDFIIKTIYSQPPPLLICMSICI